MSRSRLSSASGLLAAASWFRSRVPCARQSGASGLGRAALRAAGEGGLTGDAVDCVVPILAAGRGRARWRTIYVSCTMVGMAGFEPAASCSQSRRANQAAPHPADRSVAYRPGCYRLVGSSSRAPNARRRYLNG